MKTVQVLNLKIANNLPFALIAGPCTLEGRDKAMRIAETLVNITNELKSPYIFKASFDKANRSSLEGKRGLQMEEGLKVFHEIKRTFGCPILTDVHETYQCKVVSEIVDVLQIPAFLCRQTDLIVEAA